MKNTSFIKGELAGTGALKAIGENVKTASPQPLGLNTIGMNLVSKLFHGYKNNSLSNRWFLWTLAGDLAGNLLYQGIMGNAAKGLWWRGSLLGFVTGLGSVLLPRRFGVNIESTNRTLRHKLATIGWYLLGGLAASATARLLAPKLKK